MERRQWSILQGLVVVTFVTFWVLGVIAVGLMLKGSSSDEQRPGAAVAAVATDGPSQQPTLGPSPTLAPTLTPLPVLTSPATRTPLPTATPRPTRTPWPTWTPAPPVALASPAAMPPAVALPTLDPSLTPSVTIPIPTAVPPVEVAPNTVNIVVLGSDRRPEWSEWHTDAVHIVSIQTDQAVVSVLSIPRDLYVYVPGFWMSRVNFADYYGEAYRHDGAGPDVVRDTILYNLGVRIDHYVRTDFDGLIGIVDTLGGVDIPVHCRLSDNWPYPDENGEYPILTLEPQVHHLDGETALWYSRSRMTTSVFSRERRQQQVLQALWHKLRDGGFLTQVPTLWSQAREMVATDMGFEDIVAVAQVAFRLQDENVRFYRIGYDEVTPWTTPRGGHVFLPRWEAIQPIVEEAMSPLPESRLTRTYMPVEVWNGTANTDWDLLAADRLNRAGFPAVVGQPDRRDYATSRLIVYSEYAKGTGLGYLQISFGIPDGQVIYEPGASTTFGFRMILGADYQTCAQH